MISYTLHFPDEVYLALKDKAKSEKRSVQGQMLLLIEEWLEERDSRRRTVLSRRRVVKRTPHADTSAVVAEASKQADD